MISSGNGVDCLVKHNPVRGWVQRVDGEVVLFHYGFRSVATPTLRLEMGRIAAVSLAECEDPEGPRTRGPGMSTRLDEGGRLRPLGLSYATGEADRTSADTPASYVLKLLIKS